MLKLAIINLIQSYALQYGVDPNVAISVVSVESRFNPNVIGVTGDIGLFQLKPRSFRRYTRKQLKDPVLNIKLGIMYLAEMKRICKYKDGINYLVCYNFGVKNTREKVNHPSLFPYVKKISEKINNYRYGNKVGAINESCWVKI